MRFAWTLALVACALSVPGHARGTSVADSAPLVEMKGRTITRGEFARDFLSAQRFPLEAASHRVVMEHLDKVLERVLASTEARANGYTYDLAGDALERFRRKAVVYELFLVHGRPDTILIDEEILRRDYEMWKTQVRIRAIMVDTRSEAREILSLAEQGEDFAELARSRGRGGEASYGGDLSWKGWAELVRVPEIREAAFSMEIGEVRGVIETEYGYHVIRLDDKRAVLQPPYEDLRSEVFWRRHKPRIERAMTTFRRSIQESLAVHVDADAAALVFEKLEAAQAVGSQDLLDDFLSEKDRGRTLVTSKGGSYTVDEILEYLSFAEKRFPRGDVAQITEFLEKYAMNDLLVRVAMDRGLDQTEGFRHRMQLLEDVSVGARYKENEIYPQARATPAMAEQYYGEHPEEFATLEEARLRRIVVETRAAADSVMDKLAAGQDFAELVAAHTIYAHEVENSGDMGYIARGRFGGLLDDVAFDLKPGEVGEPLVWMGKWVIIQCLDKQDAGMLTLEEATPGIVRSLEPVIRAQIASDWMEGLKKKYEVVVHSDVLKQ